MTVVADKLKEQVAAVLETPGVLEKLAGNARNEQALADVRDTFLSAVEGHEKLFLDYLEAQQKTMELRLKSGMQRPGAKLTSEQKQEVIHAAKAEELALTKLVDAIPHEDKEITAKLLPELAETYNGAKAAAAHKEMLMKVQKTIIEQPRSRLPFASKTISDLVTNINTAVNTGADATAAKTALKKALVTNKHTKGLSDNDRQELFVTLTENHAAVVAANKNANPIDTAVANAAMAAVDEAKRLPGAMVRESLTGLPPVTTSALAIAGKVAGKVTGLS